jgi:probable phosphoglycerate mutase
MRLILIRHGQTTSNVLGALDTAAPGADLTDLGREQAAALVTALDDESIGAIFVSNLVRTQQTAAPLAASKGLTPIVRDGVREVEAGELEMRNDREAIVSYLSTFAKWAAEDYSERIPGGESGTDAFDRFDAVVAEAAALGHETVVIVSHGAMLRYWVARATINVDAEFVSVNDLTNTAIVVVSGDLARGWYTETWTGEAVGGPQLTDLAADGPTASAR